MQKYGYEYGVDPMYRGRRPLADEAHLKRQRLSELSHKPSLIEAVLTVMFYGLYKVYWALFVIVIKAGYALGDQLRQLGDVK